MSNCHQLGKGIEKLTISVREFRLKGASSRKEAKKTWEEKEVDRIEKPVSALTEKTKGGL